MTTHSPQPHTTRAVWLLIATLVMAALMGAPTTPAQAAPATPTTAESTFIDLGNGVIWDTTTNLNWVKDVGTGNLSWDAADAAATALPLAGGGWRLPSGAEFKALRAHLVAIGACKANDCIGDNGLNPGNLGPFTNVDTLLSKWISDPPTNSIYGNYAYFMYGDATSDNYDAHGPIWWWGVRASLCATNFWPVSTEVQLNAAIACFNAKTSASASTITLAQNIKLTASTTAIKNTTSGASLLIEGYTNTVDGQGIAGVRPFQIITGTVVTINRLTVTGGKVAGSTESGGGILNEGDLTVQNSTIAGNAAGSNGGGIRNQGSPARLTVRNSTVSGNTAFEGGGISNGAQAQMTLVNSTVSGNTASDSAGGVLLTGGSSASIDSVTIAGNSGALGSGLRSVIFAHGTLTNTLIADNTGSARQRLAN